MTSLPVPDSPRIITVVLTCATLQASSSIFTICGELATTPALLITCVRSLASSHWYRSVCSRACSNSWRNLLSSVILRTLITIRTISPSEFNIGFPVTIKQLPEGVAFSKVVTVPWILTISTIETLSIPSATRFSMVLPPT